MAALVIALGRARVDPPLVDREAAAADKTEAQTRPRKEAGFQSLSNLRRSRPIAVFPAALLPEETTRLDI